MAHGGEIVAVARLEEKAPWPESVSLTGLLDGQPWRREAPVTGVKHGAGYLPRAWARLEIDRLLADDAAGNRERIVRLSKASYVMSPYTSLLVLENEQMYRQYGVDRGRKDHWAMYDCPERIEVAPEPTVEAAGKPKPPQAGKPPAEVLRTVERWYAAPLLRWPAPTNGQGNRFGLGADMATVDFNGPDNSAHASFNVQPDFDSLMELIKSTVAPDRWDDTGGSGGMDDFATNLSLVVSQTQEVHESPSADYFLATNGVAPGLQLLGVTPPKLRLTPRLEAQANYLTFDELMALIKATISPTTWDQVVPTRLEFNGTQWAPAFGSDGRGAVTFSRGGRLNHPFYPYVNSGNADSVTRWGAFNNFANLGRGLPAAAFQGNGNLNGYTALFSWPAFSPDGRYIVTHELGNRRQDSAVRLWRQSTLKGWAEFGEQQNATFLYQRPTFSGDRSVFANLLAYAPGMNTQVSDVLGVLEDEAAAQTLPPAGRIDPLARALIQRSRLTPWRRVTVKDGQGRDVLVRFNGQGAYRYQRVTRYGLREEVVCDGQTLYHLYRELGVGAVRKVHRSERAWLSGLAPWTLPPADDLAVGCNVRMLTRRIVAIDPLDAAGESEDAQPAGAGKNRQYISQRLVFDADDRLIERRLALMPSGKTLLRSHLRHRRRDSLFRRRRQAARPTRPAAERQSAGERDAGHFRVGRIAHAVEDARGFANAAALGGLEQVGRKPSPAADYRATAERPQGFGAHHRRPVLPKWRSPLGLLYAAPF